MSRRLVRVALTGSECTGKTTLAARLAARFATVWVPESARRVAEEKGDPLGYEDVTVIARAHIALADAAAVDLRARAILFLDADLLSTVVYSRHYYGDCPQWIVDAARERLADLYLLHHPDVPWFPDPARDRGDRRAEMHALFRAALERMGARFADVRGDWAEREERAAAAVGIVTAALPGQSSSGTPAGSGSSGTRTRSS
jgi:NadR type nicotinamide-nucleotide adenylyltransferase